MAIDQSASSNLIVWKDIEDFENLYQVSNEGGVRRLTSKITRTSNGRTFQQTVPAKILSTPSNCKSGYPSVSLCKDGKVKRFNVHTLVARAFIGPRPPRQQVRHLDGKPNNPRASNLCYGTPVENAADRHQHGTDAKGSKNPSAVLDEEYVRRLKRMLLTETIKSVAESECLNYSTVRNIANGNNWGHVDILDQDLSVVTNKDLDSD